MTDSIDPGAAVPNEVSAANADPDLALFVREFVQLMGVYQDAKHLAGNQMSTTEVLGLMRMLQTGSLGLRMLETLGSIDTRLAHLVDLANCAEEGTE